MASPGSENKLHPQPNQRRRPKSGDSSAPSKASDSQSSSRYQEPYTLNSLWSVWYGTVAIAFQVRPACRANRHLASLPVVAAALYSKSQLRQPASKGLNAHFLSIKVYIIAKSVQRFTSYLSLQWPNGEPPYRELNAYVILTGIGVVILPFFVVATMMKIGNYPNDGRKLGKAKRSKSGSSNDASKECVYENIGGLTGPSACRASAVPKKRFRLWRLIWRHSIPTGALLHALAALCFLVPRILMEAQLISFGFLPKGTYNSILTRFPYSAIYSAGVFCSTQS